jgi:hypothetical protein
MNGDPDTLASGPTKWRADRCVTHHHACDCREWEHASQVEALQLELAALCHAADEYMAAVVAYNSNQWDRANIRKYDAAKRKLRALLPLDDGGEG